MLGLWQSSRLEDPGFRLRQDESTSRGKKQRRFTDLLSARLETVLWGCSCVVPGQQCTGHAVWHGYLSQPLTQLPSRAGKNNPNGSRLPAADLGPAKDAPPQCPMHVKEKATIDAIRGTFERMGFTDRFVKTSTVALTRHFGSDAFSKPLTVAITCEQRNCMSDYPGAPVREMPSRCERV